MVLFRARGGGVAIVVRRILTNYSHCHPIRKRVLLSTNNASSLSSSLSSSSSSSPSFVRIGSVVGKRGETPIPSDSPCAPRTYLSKELLEAPSVKRHLQWMLQKDALRQDMMLIGPPGAGEVFRRHLALALAELLRRETQLLALTQDTTESDLKQRRELVACASSLSSSSLTLRFVDQAPVSAAIHGRCLILDGLEKAERNVLPTLNNLLEHREMHLEDGRFLVAPERYEALRHSSSNDTNAALIPTHSDFRVIALAVPTPPYYGSSSSSSSSSIRSIDPPLRSRFQIRRIDPIPASELLSHMDREAAELVGLLDQQATRDVRVRPFPLHALPSLSPTTTATSTSTTTPGQNHLEFSEWLRLYAAAHPTLGNEASKKALENAWNETTTTTTTSTSSTTTTSTAKAANTKPRSSSRMAVVESIEKVEEYEQHNQCPVARVNFNVENASDENTHRSHLSITVPCGNGALIPYRHNPNKDSLEPAFVRTERIEKLLGSMLIQHQHRDICLVAPSGEGKSALANHFCRLLGYDSQTSEVRLVPLYREMTARDLLLRRSTCAVTGATTWEDSELLVALQTGGICILDGIEQLRPHVLSSALQSLCVDRDCFLPDGRRVLKQQKQEHQQLSNGEPPPNGLEDYGTSHRIVYAHPSFRILALATPPERRNHNGGSTTNRSIVEEAMDLFAILPLNPVNDDDDDDGKNACGDNDSCLRTILESIRHQECPEEVIDKLLMLRKRLSSADLAEDCGVAPLSTRNLVRVLRGIRSRADGDEEEGLLAKRLLRSIFVADLLPPSQRATLEGILGECGILVRRDSEAARTTAKRPEVVEWSDAYCRIGSLEFPRTEVARPEMVPAPRFFDIPYHVAMIRDLMEDWSRGERAFLLLGNQGVGKNMILDRLCQLANFEREYIQLHRDSTIGQITLQPTLEEGKIVWKDSPLLRAVRDGLTLVVDEADKAPTEVLSALKGLVEDGELLLADGRRISRHNSSSSDDTNVIPIHPDFTLWVLANRPGFPFLGNAFFRLIGDCFSTRVIANPDLESEIRLLEEYGPGVDSALLQQIASSFAELRRLSDIGDIAYPYSTREAVAIVKHLEKYPSDGVVAALHNVLDFDSYEDTVYSTLAKVFQHNGIPVEEYGRWKEVIEQAGENLDIEFFGGDRSSDGTSSSPPPLGDPKRGKWDENNEAHVGGNQWAGGTGGSDTAGLGGRGGPYRLDRGHKVHQVSDEDKARVSEETKRAAKAIAEKALKEKLEEIDMSAGEWDMYHRFADPIKPDVIKLRSFLNQIEMTQKERGWIKNQSHGELDDSKIVDSVVGEKYVYKRRGMLEESGSFSQRPKRLRFVMDCSASMYRFNGYDERLTRELEVTNLIMESFAGMEQRFDYSIVGHSGDSPSIPLVDFGAPPSNEKERMKILQTMIAHTQYCQSGDHTLPSLGLAIEDINAGSANDDDENNSSSLVIALSDANLERYGIHPRSLARTMESGDAQKVKSHCIFLASFGSEADSIRRELPPGRGHVCKSTQDLPRIVRDILTSNA